MRKPDTAAYVYLAVLSLLLAAGLAAKGARSADVSADLTSRGVHAEATVVAVTQQIEDIEPYGGARQWTDVTVSFIDAQGSRVRAPGKEAIPPRSARSSGLCTIRRTPPMWTGALPSTKDPSTGFRRRVAIGVPDRAGGRVQERPPKKNDDRPELCQQWQSRLSTGSGLPAAKLRLDHARVGPLKPHHDPEDMRNDLGRMRRRQPNARR